MAAKQNMDVCSSMFPEHSFRDGFPPAILQPLPRNVYRFLHFWRR